MYLWVVCSLAIVYSVTVSVATSDFSTSSVKERDNVNINCNTTDSRDVSIYWTKGYNKNVYQTGVRLQILGVSRNDSGNYTCHVTGPARNITVQTVYINVQYAAEITQFSVDPASPIENQTITITCTMVGNPNPAWQIFNGGVSQRVFRSHEPGKANITLHVARCGKNVNVKCMGGNSLNDLMAVKTQDVTASCPPRPDPEHTTDHELYLPVGLEADFFENVIGYPAPTYTWSRDDGQPMGKVEKSNYPSFAILNISDITTSDFGNYALTVSNYLGNYSTEFSLIRYEDPDFSSSVPVVAGSVSKGTVYFIAIMVAKRLLL